MNNWGLQLFTVRDFMKTEDDIIETFSKIKKMGYTEIQTAGCAIPYKRFGELANEFGLKIIGTHYDFNMMVNDFEQALEDHKLLGTTNMGVAAAIFDTVDDVFRFIEDASKVAENAKKNGMKFSYHHHAHEFFEFSNGKTAMEMLIDGFKMDNMTFILDTYWLQVGGVDVRAWIEMLNGRVDILHLKDLKIKDPTPFCSVPQTAEVGSGNMDWKKILNTASGTHIKHYVVEQDNDWSPNCFASARKSINYLNSLDL